MSSDPPKRDHQSHMLRLWQVEDAGKIVWRASLQDILTGKQKGFVSLQDLFAHLTELTSQAPEVVHLVIDDQTEKVHIEIKFQF
ncbi:MAG: hypothetical protein DWQ07_17020 [Chloroflexi bacterium]|nr:MAG: hypothetical protein DWQ07_17020 [Chloroflexota bacterium]MBL1195107.1 hypothetical protein [Chloroflexota bacterium]